MQGELIMAVDDFVSYFKMNKTPFTNTIDTEYLFKADSFLSNQNKLKLAVQNNSFAVLTGEPGTGKSTFLRLFASTLDPKEYLVLYVSMSNASPRWIYSVPLEQLGIKSHVYVNDARKQFHNELEIQRKTYNKKVVMIIDEAHLLTQGYRKYDLLEEIRFLLNGKSYDSGSPLSLILSGQNELWDVLKQDRCKAIIQRIMYLCKTSSLSKEQVGPYMAAHLRWAGTSDNLFASDAVDLIADLSDGVPRIINKICMHALNYAALKNVTIVTKDLVAEAANNEVVDVILRSAQ